MPNAIKAFFVAACLLFSATSSRAQTVVDQGTVHTTRGIGGYTEISYAFAQGDMVEMKANTNKVLQSVTAMLYPGNVLVRQKSVRQPVVKFTMPEEGFVTFRFVSDRGGVNTVDYTVTRTPAPDGPAQYNTKVNWQKPVSTVGGKVPKKAE